MKYNRIKEKEREEEGEFAGYSHILSLLFLVGVSYLFRGSFTQGAGLKIKSRSITFFTSFSFSLSFFDLFYHILLSTSGELARDENPPKNTRRPYGYRRGSQTFFPKHTDPRTKAERRLAPSNGVWIFRFT